MAKTKIKLFGAKADLLADVIAQQETLILVDDAPDVVVCYGGDGTLLSAEARWPGVPKLPIRNSRKGHRMIDSEPGPLLEKLAAGTLRERRFTKLLCRVKFADEHLADISEIVMNECNVHMAHINSAVRFELWLNDEPYNDNNEVLGDGFVVCTPFGSTAYYNQITHGVFEQGIGIAFKYTSEHTNHLVVREDTRIRIRLTRGPAVLAFDNKPEQISLTENDELHIARHEEEARIFG